MEHGRVDELIYAAADLVGRHGDHMNHTVAAAVLTEVGSIFTSLNLFHFTGGPCAEVAVLARSASEGERPVMIVAVGSDGRGVLAPCGRCRQTIFDYFPEMTVVLSTNDGICVRRISDLLPHAYDWTAQQHE
jgi:cytidine deaminase